MMTLEQLQVLKDTLSESNFERACNFEKMQISLGHSEVTNQEVEDLLES